MAGTKNLVVLSVNAAIIAGLRLVIQMGGPIAPSSVGFGPHRFACGLAPLAHRRTFPSESPTSRGEWYSLLFIGFVG